MRKKLRYLILIACLHFASLVHAQWQNGLWIEKQANNWHFGYYAGITFNTSPPSAITDTSFAPGLANPESQFSATMIEGAGSISDSNGNILFYTNGQTVWNANNEVMENGVGLLGDVSSVQNALIVPAPGNPDVYYIFTLNNYASGLTYSIVNMTLADGLGAITEANIPLSPDVEERITAVHHADGQNIWVVTNGWDSNQIRAFLISEEGVSATPVTSNIGIHTPWSSIGSMKISPDGSKLALTRAPWDPFTVEIFSFDTTTGEVTDLIATLGAEQYPGDLYGPIGCEFSPNSQFLYTASYLNGTVHQFDTMAGSEQEIKDSGIQIGQSLLTTHWTMQAGPDGKIYLAHGNPMTLEYDPYIGTTDNLNVINYPNNSGLASGFEEAAINLVDGRNDTSIPVFIQSYFASGILYEGDSCFGGEIIFNTLRIPGITDIVWDFGDPGSGANNTSTELEASHIFSAPGTYTVTALITSNNELQTASTHVVVIPGPDAVLPPSANLALCAGSLGDATFDLTQLNNSILGGQDPNGYTVVYYTSEQNIATNNPVSTPDGFTTSGQVIYAVVTNTATGCTTTIQFDLIVNPLPVAGVPINPERCGNSFSTAVFDLTEQTTSILGGQNPGEFWVSYYTDIAGINEITQPGAFESSGQIVYAFLYNTATGCSATTQFELIVLPFPSLPEAATFTGCSPFDLVSIAGQPDDTVSYSFFESEADAINNTNAITDANMYIVEGNAGTIFIRVQNNYGCIGIAELYLEAGNCFIPRGISPNNDAMNDAFDLSGFGVDQISIFNRYGMEVYRKSNYTAEWRGQTNSGSDLPTGTYYYVIELSTGESRTGWVYLNRQH